MNEQTAGILNALAIKFGATSEYLWAVMIKQAPITVVTIVFIDGILITGACIGFKFICKKPIPAKGKLRTEWEDEATGLLWFILCFYIIITVAIYSHSFTEIITGLFNPEYWVLCICTEKIKKELNKKQNGDGVEYYFKTIVSRVNRIIKNK